MSLSLQAAAGDGAVHGAVHGALLNNLILFGRLLRALGLDVTPDRLIEALEALDHVCVTHRDDFRFTLRLHFVQRREHLALFDRAFELFWRGPAGEMASVDLSNLLSRVHAAEAGQGDSQADVLRACRRAELRETEDDRSSGRLAASEPTYSAYERLRDRDFATLTPDEIVRMKRIMAGMNWRPGRRKSRRFRPARSELPDLRRSLRRSLRQGGEILDWAGRAPKIKPRPLVIAADISGSMERYTRLLLHFMYGLVHGLGQPVEIFVFGTRLTRITRQLRYHSVDRALDEAARAVDDWSGGTRIGEAVKIFNDDWGRRLLRGGAVVLVISDGWDRGDPALLGREMARLHRSCRRLIWLNPLLGGEMYEPLTRGIKVALSHVDDFLPVHSLASLEDLVSHLEALDPGQWARRRPIRLQGTAFIGRKR